MEEQREETLGMKDTVEAEVGKGGGRKNLTAAAKRDKAISDAHDIYVQATEAARIVYVKAKEQANKEFEEAVK